MTVRPEELRDRATAAPADVVPAELAGALESHPDEADVVGEALAALGNGDNAAEAVAAVADRLGDGDVAVRRGAAFALHVYLDAHPGVNSDAAADLAAALRDDDHVVRKHAGTALRDAALAQPSAAVSAVDSLPGLLDHARLDLLNAGLDIAGVVADADPDAAVPLLEPLFETLSGLADLDAEPGAGPGPAAEIPEAAAEYQQRHRTEVGRQRRKLVAVVGQTLVARPAAAASVVDSLSTALGHEGVGVDRARLAEVVGQVAERDPNAVAPTIESLAGLLDDSDQDVAASAAWALGTLADAAGECVADETEDRVDALVELLETGPQRARLASASLLAYLGEYRPAAVAGATEALVGALDDDAPPVRASAALALGYAGAESAVPDLRERAETDADERVRTTADAAIERIEESE